jgi:hypothetical protein
MATMIQNYEIVNLPGGTTYLKLKLTKGAKIRVEPIALRAFSAGVTHYKQRRISEEEKAQRIALLKLRRGDVFRGLLQAKGITKAQIEAMIEAMPEETDEEVMAKELARIDFEDAIEFFRGNPLVDTIGQALGITKEQLDEFFATNDYTKLG